MAAPASAPSTVADTAVARSRLVVALQVAVILAAGWFAHSPALHGSWLWDDRLDIPENELLRTTGGLWKIWSEPWLLYDFYPLKHTVQWLQWQLWGADTFDYHLTNLGLHLLSALLFWRVLRQLGLRHGWMGALLFTVHPVVVESVAWIAELKNTLSLPPLLLAAGAFLRFADRGQRRDYLGALLWFLVAMLCKSSMVMFPVTLLLFLWWQRGRLGLADAKITAPFFALSLGLGLVAIWFQQNRAMADGPVDIGGVATRLALAGTAGAFYFWKSVWPAGLIPIYPRWPVVPPAWWMWLPWAAAVAGVSILWARRATWGRHALFGLGWFGLHLAPFVGFVTVSYMGFTWVMDHFLYVPLLGLIGLAVAGLDGVHGRLAPAARALAIAAVVALCLMLASLSRSYTGIFRSEAELWSYTVRHNPDSWLAQHSLGIARAVAGRLPEAIEHYEYALRLRPDYPEARNNLAIALRDVGRLPEAMGQLEEALRLKPTYAEAHSNLGMVLRRLGRVDEAMLHYQRALALKPNFLDARFNLGNALQALGRHAEAVACYEQALRLDPNASDAHRNLAISLIALGRLPEARAEYERARQLDPSLPAVQF